jgi:hypothetical protein
MATGLSDYYLFGASYLHRISFNLDLIRPLFDQMKRLILSAY